MNDEDIKILEEMIENANVEDADMNNCFGGEHIEAIENLIKGYRELEECKITRERVNDIQEENKRIVDEKYIPKSKVKEKIEELEKYIYKGKNAPQDFLQYRIKAKIQALQELLEEK